MEKPEPNAITKIWRFLEAEYVKEIWHDLCLKHAFTRGSAAWRSGIWTVSGSILPSGNLGLEIISTLTRIQEGQFQLLAKGCALNKYWLAA